MPGKLYVVATPLGNLEDITQRALRVLKEVDVIAAEDTRHSRKLLMHYGIPTPLTSYYDEVERRRAPVLVDRLLGGESIALISDAGTPCIADPGYRLVRAAVAAGIEVVAVPGASAVAAALSIGGLPTDRFVFEGFVPPRAVGRRKFLAELADERRTIVAYEAPHRLPECLADIAAVLGDREVVVVRELSKIYEEALRGGAVELAQRVAERAAHQGIQGEVTLLIGGAPERVVEVDPATIITAVAKLRAEGISLKDAAKQLSERWGLPKREIYRLGARSGDA